MLPSVETLSVVFGRNAKEARFLLDTWAKGEAPTSEILEELDELAGTRGVEFIPRGTNSKSPGFSYLNTGETYAITLLYFPASRTWRVGSWGDVVERGNYA